MRALHNAVCKWSGIATDAVIDATLFECGLYYLSSLHEGAAWYSRLRLKDEINEAAEYAERLSRALRRIRNSHDETVDARLKPFLAAWWAEGAQLRPGDGLPASPLDSALLCELDQLWRGLALLSQTLPDVSGSSTDQKDTGGNRTHHDFNGLADGLAGIYFQISGQPPTSSTKGNFFLYVEYVRCLLLATIGGLPNPKPQFKLPRNIEALRVALRRWKKSREDQFPDGHSPHLK